jgi:D-apionolactonase
MTSHSVDVSPQGASDLASPSRAIRLFGTEEPVVPPVLLEAGPLTAELEDGNLRYIRFHGREMLRAISFIVRDRNWGTYRPRIEDLRIDGEAGSFQVSYRATAGDGRQTLRYRADIRGAADGSLSFEAGGEAETDFLTNRTGFVVLHPIAGVAGEPCRVEHVDGRVVETRFPDLIDPVQPMMDLRALTHSFAPGFSVTCRMEGDTFEMEDQRNWTDASYKTYVRPLALPWPYTLAAGERIAQRVTLSVAGAPGAALTPAGASIVLTLSETGRAAPPLGIGLDPQHAAATMAAAGTLREVGPRHVVCAHDPGRGHDRSSLARAVEAGRSLGAELWLEAVIRSIDGYEAEVAELGRLAAELGSPFTTVLVSPAPDLKCTLPGSVWPPCPPLDGLYAAARAAFPGLRLGGGMFSYFTELNRKRPPASLLDLVTFTTSALVHAGDDRSATESLESLPAIARSVRAFAGETPFQVGPSGIGMRDNPYGEAPMENPHNLRQAMNRVDPRQRGLFAAAWALGYYAHFARGGAAAVTLGGPVGEFGLAYAPMPFAQPWFDEAGAGLYPVFHVVRGLAALAGRPLIEIESSVAREVQAVGAARPDGRDVWIANLTGEDREVALREPVRGEISVLDEETFVPAAQDTAALDRSARPFAGQHLALRPYGVVRLRF